MPATGINATYYLVQSTNKGWINNDLELHKMNYCHLTYYQCLTLIIIYLLLLPTVNMASHICTITEQLLHVRIWLYLNS